MANTDALEQLSTAKDMMRWAASRFNKAGLSFSHGMDNALDEAVYLVLSALHLPMDTPTPFWDSKLTAEEKVDVAEFLQQRIEKRLPAAYITQEGWFAGLKFFVDERVLVPRSPIAELIESQFAPWVDPDDTHHILDMCTGSGCIGIACAYAFPMAKTDLSDLSEDALEVAAINIENHDAGNRIGLFKSDGFKQLPEKAYDIIVSNPPYVDDEDMDALTAEFKHEPVMGLHSGKDGLKLTRTMLSDAADFLSENGILVVEVGNSQFALQEEFPEVPFQWLEFERGGDGVFLLTRDQLVRHFTQNADCDEQQSA